MPLLDYISGTEEDQRSEIEGFLSNRWHDVTGEEPVEKAMDAGDSKGWNHEGFDVVSHNAEGNDRIRAEFSFRTTGYDESGRQTDEVINGTATAWIDEYDNVEFSDVVAELATSHRDNW